jgi:hypothetical protein
MIYKKLKELVFDFRVDFLKLHVGIRIRPLPRSWELFPYGIIPTCLWVGPIELTFCRAREWFGLQCAVSFDMELSGLSFRFNPLQWELAPHIATNSLVGYVSAYNMCGPFHIYSHEWSK